MRVRRMRVRELDRLKLLWVCGRSGQKISTAQESMCALCCRNYHRAGLYCEKFYAVKYNKIECRKLKATTQTMLKYRRIKKRNENC